MIDSVMNDDLNSTQTNLLCVLIFEAELLKLPLK